MTDAATDGATRLTGTVVKFQPGNKAVRFWIGMGAGKTKVVASIKLVEIATGKVLLERNVDGSVIKGNWGGGDSSGATRGVAIEIAKRTKKLFPYASCSRPFDSNQHRAQKRWFFLVSRGWSAREPRLRARACS